MKVWVLNEDKSFNFEYDVPKGAFEDDLLPSVPYMRTAPPEIGNYEKAYGEDAGSQSERWVIKPDYVGVQYWLPDGTSLVCEEAGVALPENASLEPPIGLVSRISASQLIQQLIHDGKDDDVYPAIEAIQDVSLRKILTVRYERETVFVIDEPYLVQLAAAVGYDTPEKRQEFFNKASQL